MPKETWMIASALTIALLLGLLGFSSYDKKQRLDQAQEDLAKARALVAKSQGDVTELKNLLGDSQQRIDQLQQEKDAALQAHRSLEDEMRTALESKDVTISKLQGKLTVNILDRILFDSGEADLKPEGEAVLRKVADILAHHQGLKIHVIGHTDNVPIRSGARNRYASNWELSTARATAAVRFLSEKAGVDPRRLGAVGYGEFRPVADNSTPEGRSKNRRIAITILSEELAGADVTSAGARAPGNSTNTVPETAVAGPGTGDKQ
ncbi:MAG TPA: OmpA family protein [Candidatus Limnocylindrales bacterium]|jgi:chemotaxis protein MotB|nr:OmpA family protein [Candidatus Limnocylindrales bacterium]